MPEAEDLGILLVRLITGGFFVAHGSRVAQSRNPGYSSSCFLDFLYSLASCACNAGGACS